MVNEKLAREIYKLAMELESSTNDKAGSAGLEAALRKQATTKAATVKTADRMVQFTDGDGNTVILPYDAVGNQRWIYSPYDRSRAERSGVFNVQLSGKLEDAFGQTASEKTAAGVKTADRMVQFKDEAGHMFILPYDLVGQARWAYSPFDKTRAQRQGVLNVQMNEKMEEAFGA